MAESGINQRVLVQRAKEFNNKFANTKFDTYTFTAQELATVAYSVSTLQ